MNIIISSESTRKAFDMVLEVLKRLLGFDDAFVLREDENACLAIVASSSPDFENLVWRPGVMFKHVLSGNSLNLRDISYSTDWQGQPPEIHRRVKSALHTPFNTKTDKAMLVCTSRQEGFFKKSHIELLERFSPLAGQALYNMEINDRLRNEINERKQAVASLETALTELRAAENALRAAYDDLERRVEERTTELRDSNILLQREINERKRVESEKEKMFAQLLQSQKMESIGILAGGIAHDFNNILTTILGYSELAATAMSEDDPLRPRMEAIHAAGERASALTRQLLAFSRKQIMEIKVINLNILIMNMAKMLGRLIGENIKLELGLKELIGNIKADPGQIEQVLMNLAVNSRDAMPQGGSLSINTGEVSFNEEVVARHPDMKPGAYVMLAVQDTGEGMTKDIQKDIFEPFFTTKARGKGTGLGLATVYGIVKQHNGFIDVESEPGQGALFTVYFPVTEEEVSEHGLTRHKPKTFCKGTETVLVVDDDPTIRGFVTNALAPLGYTCLSAANGKEALQLAETSGKIIDLLLTDIVMPEMNGPELAKLFKKYSPGAKVIFMSGYASDIDLSKIVSRDYAFLQKPLTPTRLLDKLCEVLGVQPGDRKSEHRE